MAESRKSDIRTLSAQELYDNFQECLEEMINRGMSVYYRPPGASREDHMNFPVESIENMVVFNSVSKRTDVDPPSDSDGQNVGTVSTGWKYHNCAVESDGSKQNDDGSVHENDQMNSPQNTQFAGNQYGPEAQQLDHCTCKGSHNGQHNEVENHTNFVRNAQFDDTQYDSTINVQYSDMNTSNGYQNGEQNQAKDISCYAASYDNTAQEALPIVDRVATVTQSYGTFPSTSEKPSDFSSPPSSHNPDSPIQTTPPQCAEEKWVYAVLVTESMMYNHPHSKHFPQCNFNPNGPRLFVPQIVEAVPNGNDIQKFLGSKDIKKDLEFCNQLSTFIRNTQKYLIKGGFLVLRPAASQAAPATLDYGTFQKTSEKSSNISFSLTSHRPNTPVSPPPRPLQSAEEKWADAVSFTASEMNENPYCKYFPLCFFNPDGPKPILPQIVEKVPTAAVIREFLQQKKITRDQNSCEKLSEELKRKQGYMMNRGFVKLGKLSPLSRKRSSSPVAPSFDSVQEKHADWKNKREERRKS